MDERIHKPVAVITGGSSGIGAAAAAQLAQAGYDVVLGARRVERLKEVAERCGGRALALDVTDPSSVEAFVSEIEQVHLLVNNAGLALGRDEIADLSLEDTTTMWETNVMGLLRVTQALIPKLRKAEHPHIINIGSIAGVEPYIAGGGYTASKHAVHSISRTLRMELVGDGVRVTEILPGLVETEFSIVRFKNDEEKARKPYEGITPLTAEDIADCITWAATRPPHVNIDEIVVKPQAQATATMVVRTTDRSTPVRS